MIDPDINTAKEVHEYLLANALLNETSQEPQNQFSISIPDRFCKAAETDAAQNFTYTYNYSRNVNHVYDTRHVPMGNQWVNQEVLNRVRKQMPEIYNMMLDFENEASN